MSERRRPNLDRIRHFQGERLLARDLRDGHCHATAARGLHVVALHNTWGIATGLEVVHGPAGFLVVGPGLAYDAYGREIVLPDARLVHGPPGAGERDTGSRRWELWARLPDDAAGKQRGRSGHDAGNVELNWRRPGEGRPGREVPLVGLERSGEGPGQLEIDPRVYAAALSRAHTASGRTPPGQRWGIWSAGEPEGQLLGFQTRVETQAAGFVGTPVYVASISLDPRLLVVASRESRWDPAWQLFTHVADARPDAFTFRVVLARPGQEAIFLSVASTSATSSASGALPIHVSWVGVEPGSGCGPALARDMFGRTGGVTRATPARPDEIFFGSRRNGGPIL